MTNGEFKSLIKKMDRGLIPGVHVFSSHVYGLRTYKERIEEDENL